MQTKDQATSELPLERVATYVASLIAVGAFGGFISWALLSSIMPSIVTKESRKDFIDWGGGLAGVAVFVWLGSEWAFH